MPSLTPVQAQWFWLLVAIIVTAVIVTLDVVMIDRDGMVASLSKSFGRTCSRYWTVSLAFAFWLGMFFGHARFPVE